MKKLLLLLTSCAAFGGTMTGFGSYSLDNLYDTYANACLSGQCVNNIPVGPSPDELQYVLTVLDVPNDVIEVTSYQEFQTRFIDGNLNLDWWARGTFVICDPPVVAPEPVTWALVIIGLLGLILLGKFRGNI